MLTFDELLKTDTGYRLDGEDISESDPRYQQILQHIADSESASETAKAAQKHRAYLSSTDWYIVREMETGKPTPEDIKQARAAARASIPEAAQ